MHLTGNIEDLRKATLLLQKVEDSVYKTIDSVEINGNEDFKFEANINSPEVYFLTMRFKDSSKTEQRIPFFAEAKAINIKSRLKDFEYKHTITGSINHDKWEEYLLLMKRFNDRNIDLIQYRLEALKANDNFKADSLEKLSNKLITTRYLATVNFAKNNADFEIAPYLMLTEVQDINIKYQDTIFNLMPQNIKDSKYGKIMESFINNMKNKN